MKRTLAMLLAALMALSQLPAKAFAEETVSTETVAVTEEASDQAIAETAAVVTKEEYIIAETEEVTEVYEKTIADTDDILNEVWEQKDTPMLAQSTTINTYKLADTYNIYTGSTLGCYVQLPSPSILSGLSVVNSRIKAVERADGMPMSGNYTVTNTYAYPAYGYTYITASFSEPGTYHVCIDYLERNKNAGNSQYWVAWRYIKINVNERPVSSIKVSPTNVTLSVGERSNLTYTVEPSNATHPGVYIQSTDPDVVYANDTGEIIGLKPGIAVVSVISEKYPSVRGTCVVTVKEPEHKHSYKKTVTVPNCTERGYTTYTCSCGDSYVGDYVASTGHTEVTLKGNTATCTEPGLTDGKKCSVCGTVTVAQQTLSAKGHTEVTVAGKPASCTESGLTDGKKCSTCGTVTVALQAISATGHKEITVTGKAATCTTSGLTDGKKCSVCGTVITAQQEITAKGHTWDGGVQTTAPTEETMGVMTYTCTICDETKTETIPALDHVHNYDSTVTAPTCVDRGYTEYTCACGHSYQDSYVHPTGEHTYNDEGDTTCNVCGAEREIAVASVPMFRMYDPNSGEHFYTGSTVERDFLVEAGWHYEGVGFNFPVEGKPVYRLYEPVYGEHLYTMDEAEKAKLISWGWNDEGVAFNSAETDEVPQYRLHNPNAKRGGYHFTGSIEERDFLISIGWIDEGIGWYSCLK